MPRTLTLALCAVACLLSSGCPDGGMPGETRTFDASLSGAQEVPPVVTTATGTGTFTVDTGTRVMQFQVTFSGLSGAVTGAHLHNGPVGVNAGVSVDLTADFPAAASGMATGTRTLTASQLADMIAGNMYVNVHTADNPNGEIRGQLVDVP